MHDYIRINNILPDLGLTVPLPRSVVAVLQERLTQQHYIITH